MKWRGEMEDTATKEGLYQQGRFPSVVDTDDLVFELGKQVVDKINKEKLLDSLVKKIQPLEEKLLASESAKMGLANKIEEFKTSNNLYVQNNEKLNVEITRLRNKNESLCSEYDKKIEILQSELNIKTAELIATKSVKGLNQRKRKE